MTDSSSDNLLETEIEEKTLPIEELKSRTIMYENQIEHLEKLNLPTTRDELFYYFKEKFKPIKLAVILHDKDLNKDGNYVQPHFHVAMSFENPVFIVAQANKINDVHGNFTAFRKHGKRNFQNLFSYLCHRTEKAKHKFQYSPHDVKASFNYPEWLSSVTNHVILSRNKEIKALLDDFGNEKYSLQTLESLLSPSEYADNANKIKIIQSLVAEKRYKRFKISMLEQEKQLEVFYLYGSTGTGKTRFAKERFADDCFTTGSNRDLFSNYNGESIVIIDELRPDIIQYNELLKLLDPFNFDNVVGSRYFDKKLVAEKIIITTPYSPEDFYHTLKHPDDIQVIEKQGSRIEDIYSKNPDKAEQFYRRINVLKFQKDLIIPMYFDENSNSFRSLEDKAFTNNWTQKQTFKKEDEYIQLINTFIEGNSHE